VADSTTSLLTATTTNTAVTAATHQMLQVYEHYKELVAKAFNDSAVFKAVLDDACKAFVNAMPSAPEWLARYAHCLLDKGFKESKLDEQSRNDALDRVGFLFAYIADKVR
jgi:Cullin family